MQKERVPPHSSPSLRLLRQKRIPEIFPLPSSPEAACAAFGRSGSHVSRKIAKNVNREHPLNGSLFDRRKSDVEDEIMRTSVHFIIISVASLVAIGVADFSLYPAEAQAQDMYGAIAYSSSTGRYGYSYDWGSRSEAEDYARSQCGRSDCAIKVWFKNACGALAVGQTRRTGLGLVKLAGSGRKCCIE